MTTPHGTVSAIGEADVVVVGAGAAGMATALHAAPARVALLTDTDLGADSASAWAQGGIAAALGAADSPGAHADDTLAVGGDANDRAAVTMLTAAAPAMIGWLDALGARFERDDRGLVLGREAGHRHNRIVHANGDATGREIVRTLAAEVAAAPHVTIHSRTNVVGLLVDNGAVVGVLARRATASGDAAHHHGVQPPQNEPLVAIRAGAVVLATGGSAGAWRHTTNPPGSRGSGLVLAADAGAALADLQYVQFHPTALNCEADPLPLLTEALRGAGATLVNGRGVRVLRDVHPEAELAPRDVVARAIWQRREAGEHVHLDLRAIDDLERRFPTAVSSCRAHGLDPLTEPVPVTPAAHYHMGGVAVDHDGRTTVPGLYAGGEVACTGAHGANRLASNSLLEALVFGERIGHAVMAAAPPAERRVARAVMSVDPTPVLNADPAAVERVRRVLTTHVGVLRTGEGLQTALDELAHLTRPEAGGATAAVARMIATAARAHRERRGAHWRADGARSLSEAPRVVVTAPDRTEPVASVRSSTRSVSPATVLAGV